MNEVQGKEQGVDVLQICSTFIGTRFVFTGNEPQDLLYVNEGSHKKLRCCK
jgi:hypothetical protein